MIELPKGARRGRDRYFARINQSFVAQQDDDHADIVIYDEISPWGVSALQVREALSHISAPQITVKINSPGGDVFDGITIHNDLRSHPALVNVKITGLAASAASIIAMAGDTIEMIDNAFIMIHNAWTLAIGDRHDMTAMADVLNEIDGALARTYANRTGIDAGDIAEMMDAETWLSGESAVEKGFADIATEAAPVEALFDLAVFNSVPVALKRQIEAGLRDAGYSKTQSAAAISAGFHALSRRDAGDRPRRDAATAELIEIATALRSKYAA